MKILVTSYVSPDLDGFACAIAYAELLTKSAKPAEAAIYGRPHDEALFLIKHFNLEANYSSPDPTGRKVILVDMSELNGKEERIKPSQVTEIVDHRAANDSRAFPKAKVQIELVGSAATLIAEKYQEKNMEPSWTAAVLLHGAIISNTLNFKAKVTTERDRSMAKWLTEYSQIPADFARQLFVAKSNLEGQKLIERLESEHAVFTRAGKRVDIVQLEIVNGLGFLEKRLPEIENNFAQYQKAEKTDYMFLTLIDLMDNRNIFFGPDKETQALLAKTLNAKFENNIAIRPGFIMRKEIVPLLEQEITRQS